MTLPLGRHDGWLVGHRETAQHGRPKPIGKDADVIIGNMPQLGRRAKLPPGVRVVADPPTRSGKVLQAAADLLRDGGVEAVSTRAVAAAAGVQPPVIYREFGGKDELLDAVTHFILEDYLRDKRHRLLRTSDDALHDLRQLWDVHVQFGLAHPDTYVLTFAQSRPGKLSSGAAETIKLLEQIIARLPAER